MCVCVMFAYRQTRDIQTKEKETSEKIGSSERYFYVLLIIFQCDFHSLFDVLIVTCES